MTPKELLYLEDALGHAAFMQTQSCAAETQLNDPVLRSRSKEISETSRKLFDRFLSLV